MKTKGILLFIKLSFLLPAILLAGKFDRIHFLHHSTGRNLIDEGGVYDLFNKYNQEHNTTFQFSDEWSTPSGNYPYDYYIDTFSPERLKNCTDTCDVIIFKHCFPGSDILEDTGYPDINSSERSLENYKLQYRALRDRFDQYPDTKFLIMTIPPLHRNHPEATPEKAVRAQKFAKWIMGEFLTENGPHYNIEVFDFRSLLTGPDGYLKYEYEINHDDNDCHPNKLANETIGPLFFNAIIQFCNQSVSPPIIYKLLSPTISKEQLVSGTKSSAADTIEILIPTATVSTVELASDTTWQVLVNDMSEGWNYITATAKSSSFLDSEPAIDSIFVDSVNDPPTTFSINEPKNNYSTYDSLITFIWRPAIDLDPYDEVNYRLELCDSSDFNVPLAFKAQADTFVTIKRPGFGYYWWRVKALDKQLAATYSNGTWRIRFAENIPPLPFSLVEPQNNYLTSDSLITFIWRQTADLDFDDEVNYQLELCDSSDFSLPIIHTTEKDTILTIKSPDFGDYWWRAKAIDNQLTVTYSNEIWRIRFAGNNSPSVFSLIEPQNNYLTSDSLIAFIWRPAADLDINDEVKYQLELCDSSDFNMPLVYDAGKDTIVLIAKPGVGDYWWRVKAIDKQLTVTYSNEIRKIGFTGNASNVKNNTEVKIPNDISLKQNYPNPFNSNSLIQFQIDGKSKIHITLIITNLLGHIIKILVDEYKLPGIYTIQWDGKDNFGKIQNSGVYLCTIRAGAFNKTIKLMLIK